ncbi:MAG: energy-coupling factor ABC transporter ATP-binding protein [Roseburia sp.]|nr:energy-coupling factor ABC transporter ATP-binding protein [Roseburia sp.]
MDKSACLTVNHLGFSYHPGVKILSDISLTAREGETIGLIGANGMGKSTLLKILVGLLEHEEGDAEICGIPLKKENYREIRKLTGYVFQDSDSQLFMPTVYEDVMFGPKNYGFDDKEARERTDAALAMVHMEGFGKRRIYELSGGEKKRISIATILALSPKIILMDEPTVALDPKNRKNFMQVLKELQGLKIIATHDLGMVEQCCDRVILLDRGKIAADGDAKKILSDEKLLKEHGLY